MTKQTKQAKQTKQRNNKMSRQPPLPAGLPPRPSGPSDSYRPQLTDRTSRYDDRYDDRDRDRYDSYHPPPPPPHPAQPPVYNFRGAARRDHSRSPPRGNYVNRPPPASNSYRPPYNDERGPLERGFNFRYDAPPGLDHSRADTYRPRSPPPRPRDYYKQENNNSHRQNNHLAPQRGGARGGYRGRAGPRMASDREFLKTNRAPTPELMPGMDDDAAHAVRYIPVEDVSDSEDEPMDMSDDDQDEDETENDGQPQKKQARTQAKAADGDSVPKFAPKWSNPDPYTVLPPPDESLKKKKDMVKLIRKARVTSNSGLSTKTEAAPDDFISFDFDDDVIDVNDEPKGSAGHGMQDAPTGPRSEYRHNGPSRFGNEYAKTPENPEYPMHSRTHVDQRGAPPFISNSNFQDTSSNIRWNAVNSSEVAHSDHMMQNAASLPPGLPGPSKGSDGLATASNQPSLPLPLPLPLPTARVGNYAANNHEKKKPVTIDLTSDPALGTRKRTHRDELKPPPKQLIERPKGKKAMKEQVSGDILSKWKAKDGIPTTPWISDVDHSETTNMGVWLHKEIMDWYHHVKPRPFEQFIREKLVEELRNRVKKGFELAADVRVFGSFPAGLYLPTADMDLVCVSRDYMQGGYPQYGSNNSLNRFKKFLEREALAIPGSIDMIRGAKVPLVKFVDRVTGLKCDISFENDTGLIANKTFQEWKTTFPAMPILVTLIKHLLSMRGLNEPVNGGIGGFSVTCLVVSLLQNMPQVQSGTMIPEHHLGEILMEFLDLYGNKFNTTTTAITLNPPGYVSKSQLNVYKGQPAEKFCIIDPNKTDNDIAGGSRNTMTIREVFSESYDFLKERMAELRSMSPHDRRYQSILGCVVGGDYSSFELQRKHLAHVHETKFGSSLRD